MNPSNRNFAPRVGLAGIRLATARPASGPASASSTKSCGAILSECGESPTAVLYVGERSRQRKIVPFPFPNAYALINSPRFTLGRQDVVQYRPNSPYTIQYNFTVQRQVAARSLVTAGYAGERGVHLPELIDGNQATPTILADGSYFFPPNSTVQNPNFTGIRYKETAGQSYYNALQVSFEQRFSKVSRSA